MMDKQFLAAVRAECSSAIGGLPFAPRPVILGTGGNFKIRDLKCQAANPRGVISILLRSSVSSGDKKDEDGDLQARACQPWGMGA